MARRQLAAALQNQVGCGVGTDCLEGTEPLTRRIWGVLLLFGILSMVLTYPLSLHLADAVEDRQDALLNVWITAWDGHQLVADPFHLFDANIFSPYRRTLAYSELLLGNGLLSLPITALTGNPILGYNLALLLSFVLTGFGTYLLLLTLTRSHGAGLVGGAILAFSSYRLTNLAQAQLLITQWMPFALLALHQMLHRPRRRHIATFVLFFCLQSLSSFYYAILLALTVALYVLFWLTGQGCRHRDDLQAWWQGHRRPIGFLLLAALLCACLVAPFALPYFGVQRELGFERSLADNEPFSASLRQYGMVPPGSVLHGRWLPSDSTPIAGGYPVDALFPGLLALLLGAWGIVRGRGSLRWFFVILLPLAFVLSLGPRLYWAPGQPADLSGSLPYAWLYAIVPGFKALRAPARFDVLVTLSLAVLAGYGLASLRDRAWMGQNARRVLLAGVLAGVVVESWVFPAAQVEPVPVGEEVPAVVRWLASEPPGVILELPMAFTPGGPKLDYQYLSTYHWQTTPDGYSGFIPPKHGQIVYEMETFPSERAVGLLQALGVGVVVIHTERYPQERWQEMQAALAQFEELTPVKAFDGAWVYRVLPRSFDARSLEVTGYIPPRARTGEPYTVYVIVANEGPRSHAFAPTDLVSGAAVWAQDGNRIESSATGDIPLVISPDGGVAVIPLTLSAPSEPGDWRLSIGEQGGALGHWQAEGMVRVGKEADEDLPVPARLVSWTLPERAAPGESIDVALTWGALGKIDAYYSVYVKVLDAAGQALVGWDGQPRNGEAPTLLWVPGQTIDDTITLTIPKGAAPGDYQVEVGMYRAEDLARCLTLNDEGVPVEQILLGTVSIGH